jgi:large conductance mechanosensitive channel
MLREFQRFIMRGNVMGLAIGVVIGAAFTAIIDSLVGDILMPIFGALMGGIDFTSLSVQVGEATIAYGSFIQALINFLLISLTVFLVIRAAITLAGRMGVGAEDLGLDGIVEQEKKKAEPEPQLSEEVSLLAEIRDILRAQEVS